MREGAIRKVAALLRLGRVIKTRDWIQAACPFARWKHRSGKDSKPSFGMRIRDTGRSHYYCFTCHASGPIHSLPIDLAEFRKNGPDAQQQMLEVLRIDMEEGFGAFEAAGVEEEIPEPLDEAMYGDVFPPAWEVKQANAYLLRRGVTRAAMEYLNIGADPEDRRVVWPVRGIDGLLYGYTGRSWLPKAEFAAMGDHYQKSKDYLGLPKKFLLLNIHQLQPGQKAVTVEGPMDVSVAASHLLGTPYVPVGLLGSALLDPKADMLIESGNDAYLFMDNDDAGALGIFGDGKRKGAVDKLVADIPVFVPEYPDRAPYNANDDSEPEEGELDVGKLSKEELITALDDCPPWSE